MPEQNLSVPALQNHPRATLGHCPTPVDAAPRLGAALGIELYIKRDDCTGLAFGGNKARQLEYYFGQAREADADTALITGAVQSNFVRMAAAAARKLGMQIHIQLEERVANPDPNYRNSGNVLLDRLLGAHLHSFQVGEDEGASDRALDDLARELQIQGRRPYVIHLGVEHPPIGALGYVRCAGELSAQWAAADQHMDAVVVASGSGLTHAGLLVGLRAQGHGLPVHGICVRRSAALQQPRLQRRSTEICELLQLGGLIQEADVQVHDQVLAPGYGKINDATFDAIHRSATLEGLMLDPVYTGKAMAGLIELVRSGVIAPGSTVLFVHTGGTPALFGYQADLEQFMGATAP